MTKDYFRIKTILLLIQTELQINIRLTIHEISPFNKCFIYQTNFRMSILTIVTRKITIVMRRNLTFTVLLCSDSFTVVLLIEHLE